MIPLREEYAKLRDTQRSKHAWYCPANAALSIVARGITLGISFKDPLSVYCSPKHKEPFSCLRSYQVISIIRQACVDAYADKHHYMRKHVKILTLTPIG
jgi:hypothetical protein